MDLTGLPPCAPHPARCILKRHFILVEFICAKANQSEAKFLSLPLKFCQNSPRGNISIDFSKGKMN